MSTILLSPAIPFPPLSWWLMAIQASRVVLDKHERYQKMSYRNRYYLAGPQGKQLMSFPLEKGRNQRRPMLDVKTMDSDWALVQEKTIRSLYQRAPFFEHYEPYISQLLKSGETHLFDRSRQSIAFINHQLNLNIEIQESEHYAVDYSEDYRDIRTIYRPQIAHDPGVHYMQVFEDRTGFLPDCSILDLLFCEGKMAEVLLKEAAGRITL